MTQCDKVTMREIVIYLRQAVVRSQKIEDFDELQGVSAALELLQEITYTYETKEVANVISDLLDCIHDIENKTTWKSTLPSEEVIRTLLA